jgi:glutathione S-transferase
MLEELGIDYETEVVDIRSADRSDTDEFLAASPMGKVPAIVDGEVRMSESAAICLYLADRYSSGTLAPGPDDAERGRFLYWLMYTPAVIEPAMSEKFNKVESNKGRSGWGDFDTMIQTFDESLAGRTSCSDRVHCSCERSRCCRTPRISTPTPIVAWHDRPMPRQ